MWYTKITTDITQIPAMTEHFEAELADAREECKIQGVLETNAVNLPGQTEYRFAQLQELEAIINYLNLQARRVRRGKYETMEKYAKALTAREVDKYIDGDEDVVELEIQINEVALIRNRYLGILKAFEQKSFMVGHVSRLRTAGMEDIKF